jgi:antitoxin YefM
MNAVSYTAARGHFVTMMEKVCQDHAPIIITRQKAESVVLMSLKDFESLMETVYLLKSPKNANRVMSAIKEIESGKSTERDLLDNED